MRANGFPLCIFGSPLRSKTTAEGLSKRTEPVLWVFFQLSYTGVAGQAAHSRPALLTRMPGDGSKMDGEPAPPVPQVLVQVRVPARTQVCTANTARRDRLLPPAPSQSCQYTEVNRRCTQSALRSDFLTARKVSVPAEALALLAAGRSRHSEDRRKAKELIR